MSKRIAYLFDARSGVGIGHYARVRALRHWLTQIFGYDSVIIGWGDGASQLNSLVDVNTQFARGAKMFSHLSGFLPEVIVIDSYDIEQLHSIVQWSPPSVKLAFAEAFATEWIDGFDVLLDPTSVAFGRGRSERIIAGVDAVLLNKENYSLEDGLRDLPNGIFFNCGKSALAAQMLERLGSSDSLGEALRVKPGKCFGLFSIPDGLNVSIGDLNRLASEVVVSAGQALWEAALNRESFYLVALSPVHLDLLDRLVCDGALQIHPTSVLSDTEFVIFRCEPTLTTRQRLRNPETSARKIARVILEANVMRR